MLTNLVRLLQHGRLRGTGKRLVLPVDQGCKHGPVCSFSGQLAGMQPLWQAELAAEAGCSAHTAPLGALMQVAGRAPGLLPPILKLNGAEKLSARPDK